MDWLDLVRFIHVMGACVLIGTGAGIAFFMVMAHRKRDAASIAQTAATVVIADTLFTATAAILQPVSGTALAWGLGWSLLEGWIAASIALYVLIGMLWLPVVYFQIQMRDEARLSADTSAPLSPRYFRLYKIWFACGIPAFSAIAVLLWLMLMRPDISF
ncbi:Uncharacterized membrane protein [Litoreibacter ascidiaceicola]|uniref:Uncharacterized membrane protein n=1 Tax=Litoreibacter ascidiaceicola TaxID=1486859 RepID=A0A1M5AGN3_9RHOB|nr:DUF2269 domain-containing protein [Litoreibacter ascidiaceicola]SHF29438.1 Uncharacterized membrane protein [Litoreibacter ascidiaceicola]